MKTQANHALQRPAIALWLQSNALVRRVAGSVDSLCVAGDIKP